MTRLIIILLLIFIILSLIKAFVKKTVINPFKKNINNKSNSDIDLKSVKTDKDENIIDAKFEEIK